MKIELNDDDLKAALEMWLPKHVFKTSVKVEEVKKNSYGTTWEVEISREGDELTPRGVKP